jgi:hypothetical protein
LIRVNVRFSKAHISRLNVGFYPDFTQDLNQTLIGRGKRCGTGSHGFGFCVSAQQLAAAHNDKAVNSQFLVFLSRGRDVY